MDPYFTFSGIKIESLISLVTGIMALVGIDGLMKWRSSNLLLHTEFRQLRHLNIFYRQYAPKTHHIQLKSNWVIYRERTRLKSFIFSVVSAALTILFMFVIYRAYTKGIKNDGGYALYGSFAFISLLGAYFSFKEFLIGEFRVDFVNRRIDNSLVPASGTGIISIETNEFNGYTITLLYAAETKKIIAFQEIEFDTARVNLGFIVFFTQEVLQTYFGMEVRLSPRASEAADSIKASGFDLSGLYLPQTDNK